MFATDARLQFQDLENVRVDTVFGHSICEELAQACRLLEHKPIRQWQLEAFTMVRRDARLPPHPIGV